MANNEACGLYIEQQIAEGLEEGKTPYYIGRTISKEIEKLFKVKLKPRTIEKRARRQQNKKAPSEIIYFIQSGNNGPIKIGHTKFNINSRLKSLQTGNPVKLILIKTIKGDLKKERKIQKKFYEDNIRGEWFLPSLKLLNYIKSKKGLTLNKIKESQDAKTIEDTTPDIIKDRKPQGGGKREGAGRPRKTIIGEEEYETNRGGKRKGAGRLKKVLIFKKNFGGRFSK